MRVNRLTRAGALLAAAALVMFVGVPAYAAVPGNDTFAGPVAIGSVPFSTLQDTSEATTDSDDIELNTDCGAPATDASVWYSITADSDGFLLVDVSGSTYSAGAAVVTGAPGSFQLVACGPEIIAFETVAGQKYYIVAFDDQFDGGGNGGTLSLRLDVPPPPPVVSLTVDPTASFDPKTGSATVTGTIVCEGLVEFGVMFVKLTQQVGRGVVSGSAYVEGCTGTVQKWSVEVVPAYDGTKFAGGKAASVVFSFACGPIFCSEGYEERTVQLTRR